MTAGADGISYTAGMGVVRGNNLLWVSTDGDNERTQSIYCLAMKKNIAFHYWRRFEVTVRDDGCLAEIVILFVCMPNKSPKRDSPCMSVCPTQCTLLLHTLLDVN